MNRMKMPVFIYPFNDSLVSFLKLEAVPFLLPNDEPAKDDE